MPLARSPHCLQKSVEKFASPLPPAKTSVGGLISSGSEKIRAGVVIAGRGNEVLQNIVINVALMESHISEIAIASEEQSKGISEVNTAIGQLDNVTQVNSGAAEESAASAAALKQQAHELYQIALELNRVISGGQGNDQGESREEPSRLMALHQEQSFDENDSRKPQKRRAA